MEKVKIRLAPHGVDFVRGERFVRVDTRAHDVRLESHRGETLALGALRSGLISAMGFVLEELDVPPMRYDLSPAARAVEESLAERAAQRGLRDPSLEAAVAAVSSTPLLYAAPFLEARFVWQDALRFRACRVAVANAEDDLIDEDTPEAAAAVVERLGKWRDLFSPSGKSRRALNSALNDFGETLPAAALWGLRRVPLGRPRARRELLEVLGWLGALPPADGLDAIIAVVERAGDDELAAALGDDEPRALARRLAEGDPESTTLLQLARSAVARLREQLTVRPGQRFPAPPFPPPDVPGLRLIADVDALRAESDAMHHCVLSLAGRCARGEAFIFHAEQGGTHGTIQVDPSGRVVQARGPMNRPSIAADWGARVLGAWGMGLWSSAFDPDALTWPLALAPAPGTRPLKNVRAVVEAFCALTPAPAVRDWFVTMTSAAVRGLGGLYVLEGGDDKTVTAVDAAGHVLGDTRGLDLTTWRGSRLRRGAVIPDPDDDAPVLVRPWRVEPAIPPPRFANVRLVEDSDAFRRLRLRLATPRPLPPVADPAVPPVADPARPLPPVADPAMALRGLEDDIVAGRALAFECHPDRGVVVVRVTLGTNEVTCAVSKGAAQAEIDWAVTRLREWTYGFWAVRLGLHRSTWIGAMRAPAGGEPLETVEACARLYEAVVEQSGDRDGKLAAFFEKHAAAATRGDAWLVVRDREKGAVAVLDRKRNVIARIGATP